MATFNLELNSKPNRDNTFSILLRITQDRKHKRVKTSVQVKNKNDFNSKAKFGKWIRTSEPNHKKWNDELESEIEKAKDIYRELKDEGIATKENIVANISAEQKSDSFLEYVKKVKQEIYNAGGQRNYKKYNDFYNKLTYFLEHEKKVNDITFKGLTPSFLSAFHSHLKTLRNQRHPEKFLHPNSIAVTLNIFKTLINRAIEIDRQMKFDTNPFIGYSYKTIKTSKEKLSETEINQLEDVKLDTNSLHHHARNSFLFSFYCAGIRAGDLLQLRWINITADNRLEYQMDKNTKPRNFKLIPKAINILNQYKKEASKRTDYIFPFLDSNADYAVATTQDEISTMSRALNEKRLSRISTNNALLNKYIKKVAKQVGITKTVSMHIARHTFASIAKQKNIANGVIQELLAHENSRTTDVYMGNFDTSVQDNALNSIFDIGNDKTINELLKNITKEQEQAIIQLLTSNSDGEKRNNS